MSLFLVERPFGEGTPERPIVFLLPSLHYHGTSNRSKVKYLKPICARETPPPVLGRHLPAFKGGYPFAVRSAAVLTAWQAENNGCRLSRLWLPSGRGMIWSTSTAGVRYPRSALCRHSGSDARTELRNLTPRLVVSTLSRMRSIIWQSVPHPPAALTKRTAAPLGEFLSPFIHPNSPSPPKA